MMGFCIKGNGAKSYPSVVCDVCLKEVDDWKMANVEYETFPQSGHVSTFIIRHKGCGDWQARPRKFPKFWMQLDDFIGWLLWNKKWGKINTKKGTVTIESREPLF